jgi:hypothetical protein
MKTLETGGGLSTVIFAAKGCDHTCIIPSNRLADRIQAYCRSASIDTNKLRFIISKSCDVIHQMNRSEFDLVLIDGCHGFPTVFVDFYYAAKMLKQGGMLIIDDMHIYTCLLIARFMQSDPGWNVVMAERAAFATKISDTIDKDYGSQPFVVRQSWPDPPGGMAGFARPLVTARITMHMLQTRGVRVTAKRILKSISRRAGLQRD